MTNITVREVEYAVNADLFTTEINEHARIHGIKQKLGDVAASMKDSSKEEKEAATKEVYDRLLAGQWNKVGEGNGGETKKKLKEENAALAAKLEALKELSPELYAQLMTASK